MIKSYQLLQDLITDHPDTVDIGSGASSELIRRAEEYLDVVFPESLKLYAETWGALAIGPFVYYGIVESDFENSRVPDGVWFTARKRREVGLPHHLFVIFNNEGDEYHCLDLETGEIVSWDTSQRMTLATKSENLFDYILKESSDFV